MGYYEDRTIHWDTMVYLTQWSWYLWGLYTCLTCYYHWRYDIGGHAQPADSSSPFLPWKMTTALFGITLTMQNMVTIAFWALIAPSWDREWDFVQLCYLGFLCFLDDGFFDGPWFRISPLFACLTFRQKTRHLRREKFCDN